MPRLLIIVAGGYDTHPPYLLLSVEILDESSNEWQTGPELPFGITDFQMVEDPKGGVILVGGVSDSIGALDTLHQLPHGGKDAVWTRMAQKLEIERYGHVAFLV